MLAYIRRKYLKPRSLTWWAAAASLIAGVVVALADVVPELQPVAHVINRLTNNQDVATLINFGLFGIGLRGAIKDGA